MATQEVAKANEYKDTVKILDGKSVDKRSQQDLEDFKNYYENATEEERRALDEKFKTYLDDELKKDPELKNKLNPSGAKESSDITNESPEINERDIANLNAVRNLTDVLNNYPNISSPEYRAIKKMLDEHIQDLSKAVKKTLANPEAAE